MDPGSAIGAQTESPRLAVDARGPAHAVWSAAPTVQGAVRPAGGAWGQHVDLSTPGHRAYNPELAINPQSKVFAVWNRSTSNGVLIAGAVRPTGGPWQASVDLSTAGQSATRPQVAADAQGNAAAIWNLEDATDSVQTAGYDGAGPLLRGLAIPATGVAGLPLAFGVSPFDVWSALGAISWSFGDGGAGAGPVVAHTYASAGTFKVDVGATDALGNASSATRSVTIAPGVPVAPALAAITKLRLSPRTFRAARSGPSVRPAARRRPTRVSYTLSLAASVRFTVQRPRAGRKIGKRCVKTTRSNRGRKSCTRHLPVRGSFTRKRAAGADRFTFTGRLAGRRLGRGRYRLVATPRTADGRKGTSKRANFRIVR